MKIGILCTPDLGKTGPGVYLRNLIKHLINSNKIELHLIHFQNHYDPIFKETKSIKIPKLPFFGDIFIKKYSLDIIHFNYFYHILYLPFINTKKIVTVHGDIEWIDARLDFHPYLSPLKRNINLFSSKFMNAYIAVSYDLKNRISNYYKLMNNNIYVTHLAPNIIFKPVNNKNKKYIKNKYNLEKKFILHVSNFSWKKNPLTIFKTFNMLLNTGLDINLIIAGKNWKNNKQVNKIASKNNLLNKIKFLDFIPLRDLSFLYGSAEVFFQPSIHENCPQTILEAMACGTPVVTSNVFSIPEITGDAGILRPPTDVLGFAESIRKIIVDDEYRNNIKMKTLKNISKFSWEKTTQKTIDIYNKILSE